MGRMPPLMLGAALAAVSEAPAPEPTGTEFHGLTRAPGQTGTLRIQGVEIPVDPQRDTAAEIVKRAALLGITLEVAGSDVMHWNNSRGEAVTLSWPAQKPRRRSKRAQRARRTIWTTPPSDTPGRRAGRRCRTGTEEPALITWRRRF